MPRDGAVGHSGTVDSNIVVATCGDRSASDREVRVVVVDNVTGNADQPAGSPERRVVVCDRRGVDAQYSAGSARKYAGEIAFWAVEAPAPGARDSIPGMGRNPYPVD